MTSREQAELDELGLTPDQLKSKQRALASVTAQANVSTRGPMTLGEIVAAEGGIPPKPHGRKRRSDARTKRELRPKPQAAGVLTAEQAEKLTLLHSKLISAKWAYDSVQSEWFAYLDELQGKR